MTGMKFLLRYIKKFKLYIEKLLQVIRNKQFAICIMVFKQNHV